MNFRDEKRKRTEEIEQILKAYLPVQEGKVTRQRQVW